MITRHWRGTALLAGTVLLAGCASSQAGTTPRSTSAPNGASMTPGMVMPGGSTMGPSRIGPSRSIGTHSRPNAAARMICSLDVRKNIATALVLKSTPAPTSTWSRNRFTCTYRLPMGPLVLSVQQSPDAAQAKSFADRLRRRLRTAHSVAGLTDLAFATPTGVVALVKDNDTLQVDASRLPAQFGSQQQKRDDFAYEIASVVLGCWTGD